MRIVKIDGIKGLITAAFTVACLFAGFVIFPGYAAMHLWNKYLATAYMFPVLNLFQGVLLWGIVVISYCILSKKGFAMSFKETPELSEEELDNIIKSATLNPRVHIIKRVMQQPDTKPETEQSYISSPISTGKSTAAETKEEEKISDVK